MAYQVKVPAKGNSDANAGPVITPPPRPPINDIVSAIRKGDGSYGQNSGANNPSVIPVATQKISALAANMRASVTDPALDLVISGKCAGNNGPTGQERPISADPITPAHGMRNRKNEK